MSMKCSGCQGGLLDWGMAGPKAQGITELLILGVPSSFVFLLTDKLRSKIGGDFSEGFTEGKHTSVTLVIDLGGQDWSWFP